MQGVTAESCGTLADGEEGWRGPLSDMGQGRVQRWRRRGSGAVAGRRHRCDRLIAGKERKCLLVRSGAS
jgi:hypothetical protein